MNTNEIQSFIDSYDLKIKYLTLNEIIEFISDRPDDISSKFIVDRDSVLVFEEDSMKIFVIILNFQIILFYQIKSFI